MSIFAFLKRKIVVPCSLAKGFVTDPATKALSKYGLEVASAQKR
jgi:hypothetical protein